MLEFIRAVLQVPEVGMRNPRSSGVAASRISLHWCNVGDGAMKVILVMKVCRFRKQTLIQIKRINRICLRNLQTFITRVTFITPSPHFERDQIKFSPTKRPCHAVNLSRCL